MNKLIKYLDKIGDSVWFMTIGLLIMPFWLYSMQNNKIVYWLLALFLYIDIVKDFLKVVIKKLTEKYEEL